MKFVNGSIAYTEFYYVPRIDRNIVNNSNLVGVLTGNLYGEVPSKILNVGIDKPKML